MLDWIKRTLSDNGEPSSARQLTVLHSLIVSWAFVFVVLKTHAFPDGAALGGAAVFIGAPYAINTFGKRRPRPGQATDSKPTVGPAPG